MNCLKYGNKIYKPEILFNKIRQNPAFFAKKHGITGALLEEILGINTDKNKILSGVQMSMLSPSDFDSNGNVLPEVLAEIQAEREQIIAQSKANGTYMKAPNGKPTNLNEEQWIAVRTQRFKDWFGDWEKDPENSSKVVDDNGEPLVVYHGTNASEEFNVFEHKGSKSQGSYLNSNQPGFFFSNKQELADLYSAGKVETKGFFISSKDTYFVDVDNEIIELLWNYSEEELEEHGFDLERWRGNRTESFEANDSATAYFDDNANELYERAFEEEASDGLFVIGTDESKTIIVRNPNQIKSATDNVGTYSEDSNDIRYHKGDSQSVNDLFNKELEQLRKGQLPAGHIFQLGTPNAILQSVGLPNFPIEMSATRLKNKSEQENHPFDLSEVENLPQAIQNPIAVFDSTKGSETKVILTELQTKKGDNYVVAMRVSNRGSRKQSIEINSVKSIYPKTHFEGVLDWINSADNLMKYADTKKLLDYISVQSTNLIANGNTNTAQSQPRSNANLQKKIETAKEKATGWLGRQQFNSAEATQLANRSANVINNFKNPPINSDDNSDIDKIQNILDNATAEPMPKPIETLAEFRKEFDKPVKTPINEIRVKDNVFQKITNTNRKEISGTIRPTLENPTFIIEDTDGSKLFVKVFNKGGEKNYNVVAVNKQGEVENYLSSVHIKSNNNLKNKIKNGAKLIQPQKRLSDENGSQISSAPNSTNVQNNFKNPKDNSDIEFHIGNGNANTNTTKPKFTPPHQGLAPKALVLSIIDKIKENNGDKAEGFKLLTESEWYKKLSPQEQGNFEENTIIDYLFDWNEKTIENTKARNEWKREQQISIV